MSTQVFSATGRRKSAIAQVWLDAAGSGKVEVNGLGMVDYFNREVLVQLVEQVFEVTEATGTVDIKARVHGGGKSGQAGALRLGIARALVALDENHRTALRKAGFLTRDAREVERKKYGQPGARKRFQFSKR